MGAVPAIYSQSFFEQITARPTDTLHFLLFRINPFENSLAALELNRKSQMVSEAVEEVLNLVQNASKTFKSMMSCDSSDAAPGKLLDSEDFRLEQLVISPYPSNYFYFFFIFLWHRG